MMGIAWPPRGYLGLLRREPSLSIAEARPAEVEMDGGRWAELHEVNDDVNYGAVYAPDAPGDDVWGAFRRLAGQWAGDCDDFAVEKLRRLLARGWPRGALRLTVCVVAGVGHCVLCVVTDGGRAVLDNRHAGVAYADHRLYSGYTWVGEEWPGHTFWWRSLRDE